MLVCGSFGKQDKEQQREADKRKTRGDRLQLKVQVIRMHATCTGKFQFFSSLLTH